METSNPEYILRMIAESLGRPVQPGDKLVELADSLEIAQLILDLEMEFKVEVPDDDLKHLFTLQDVINYTHSRSAALRS